MGCYVVYRVERIHYGGDAVGNDWTFYFNTAAGLTRFGSSLGLGETVESRRVVGVFEAKDGDQVTDAWWVSVIEKDFTQDDRAVSSRHLVPIVIEAGRSYTRTINVEVADTGRLGRKDRAMLDFEISAEILHAEQPAPALEAERVPREPGPDIEEPTETAGEFAASFRAIADGVNPKSVPVEASLEVLLQPGDVSSNAHGGALSQFLENFSSSMAPSHFDSQIALYRVANPEGIRFWSSQNSSRGLRTQARIMEALEQALPAQGSTQSNFERRRGALVPVLLESRFAVQFGPAANALAALIISLTEDRPERVAINRDIYTRTSALNWFSGVWHHAFFVEPTPFSGPDAFIWLVVWSDAWEE